MYGEAATKPACAGTVSGSPRTHRNSASDGPAPPRPAGQRARLVLDADPERLQLDEQPAVVELGVLSLSMAPNASS